MLASATSHLGHHRRSLRLPSVGGACLQSRMMSAWGGVRRQRAWLTTKLANQAFELSNAVAETRVLVNVWIISTVTRSRLRKSSRVRETGTNLILGSSISYTQRPVWRECK
jgi:hypothetical protein